MMTVVETEEFIKQADNCMTKEMQNEFIHFIANNPLEGDLIRDTGGVRKIRWYVDKHSGKRGGVRIIYYYHCVDMPIFLFTAYKKNKQDDISAADKALLKMVITKIVAHYHEG